MVLVIDGTRHLLDVTSPPLAFPGDQPVMARLQGPALLNFNLMFRRPLKAWVTRGPLAPPPLPQTEPPADQTRLAFLLKDSAGLISSIWGLWHPRGAKG